MRVVDFAPARATIGCGGEMRKPVLLLVAAAALLPAQDVMKLGVRHLRVLAEDDKVRVLKMETRKGDKTPMHSHPATILYVIKGGRARITLPDGTSSIVELKTGDAQLRPPVTHSDEALDDVEAVIVELKK
jgi:quercetin dioxygenase-like cupin family protein